MTRDPDILIDFVLTVTLLAAYAGAFILGGMTSP